MNSCISVFEYEKLYASAGRIPKEDFDWLKQELAPQVKSEDGATWLEQGSDKDNGDYIKFKNHVGVVSTPSGCHIEILPKCLENADSAEDNETAEKGRLILLDMLLCLGAFKHVEAGWANIQTAKMPLLDIFIGAFLESTLDLVKRGLRSAYVPEEDNLPTLRGRLVFPEHLRRNICRKDRFYTRFDEFSPNRPENRLIRATLDKCKGQTQLHAIRLRQICDHFENIPPSSDVDLDFQRVHIERDMQNYRVPLAWARLILKDMSPVVAHGEFRAPTLLYPMEKLFESFVTQHIRAHLANEYAMKAQVNERYLAKRQPQDGKGKEERLFKMKPDIWVTGADELIMDAKWKLADEGLKKYKISQTDLYQMYAYGQTYLKDGTGKIVLVYPESKDFSKTSPTFTFIDAGEEAKYSKLKLWAVPFHLEHNNYYLRIPEGHEVEKFFLYPEASHD